MVLRSVRCAGGREVKRLEDRRQTCVGGNISHFPSDLAPGPAFRRANGKAIGLEARLSFCKSTAGLDAQLL
jgi:hypothetical protein